MNRAKLEEARKDKLDLALARLELAMSDIRAALDAPEPEAGTPIVRLEGLLTRLWAELGEVDPEPFAGAPPEDRVLEALRRRLTPEPEAKPPCPRCGATDWGRRLDSLGHVCDSERVPLCVPVACDKCPAPVPFEGLARVYAQAARDAAIASSGDPCRAGVRAVVEAVLAWPGFPQIIQRNGAYAAGIHNALYTRARDYQPEKP